MKNKLLCLAVILTAVSGFNAQATLLTNGSFEQAPVGLSNTFGGQEVAKDFNNLASYGAGYSWAVYNSLPGWNVFYGPGVEVQSSSTLAGVNAVNGNKYVELDTHFKYTSAGNSNAGIYQQLNGLYAGNFYELSFWYRARTNKADDNLLNVYWTNSMGSLVQSNYVSRVDYIPADGNIWTKYTLNLKATSSTMYLGFGGDGNLKYNTKATTAANGNGKGALLDDVSLKAIPAPATLALFGLAGFGLLLRRRTK